VYVRLPLYPAEHVNASVLPDCWEPAREAVLLAAILASAFAGVASALERPSHVVAAVHFTVYRLPLPAVLLLPPAENLHASTLPLWPFA
jgi:hypothetical protein